MGFRRGHNLLWVLIKNSRDNFRFIGFARLDRDLKFSPFGRSFIGIEAQFSFSGLFVRAVAVKALVGKDGADIAIEINGSMPACGAKDGQSEDFS